MTSLFRILGMTLFLFAPFFSAQQTDEILEGTDPVLHDPIDFILDAFDRYPVVALGEGSHMNWQAATFRL